MAGKLTEVPRSGWYTDQSGRRAHVLISGRRTGPNWTQDGSVVVNFDDGCWTAFFWTTFAKLHWKHEDDIAEAGRAALKEPNDG